MSTRELLIDEIEDVPELLLCEVPTFVHFLKAKTLGEEPDIAIMSESSLKKDWLPKTGFSPTRAVGLC